MATEFSPIPAVDNLGEDKKQSHLLLVREQLLANPAVYVAGEPIVNYSRRPEAEPWLTEKVDIFIAPQRPIFDAEGLNQFMYGLISDVKPIMREEVKDIHGGLVLGKLYFEDTLGTRLRQIVTTVNSIESESLQNAGIALHDESETDQKIFKRRIWLRLYPDKQTAQLAYDYRYGRQCGTVEQNDIFELILSHLDPTQVQTLKAKYIQAK